MTGPVDVLDFWLQEIGPAGWYTADSAVDALCRDRFSELWQAARDGGLDHWVDGTVGTMAYLVICDQLSRNMHRGHADAFATDQQALAAARTAIQNDWDMDAPEPERQFFYMPFMHSEDAADQALCIGYFQTRMPQTGADQVIHARAHEAVLQKFGRFPFRNQALGRIPAPDEDSYMANGGYMTTVAEIRASHAPDA